MKKVLVCALAALFLMASCVTAFAETSFGGASYVTTTSYTANDTLKVTTTVTGATEGTMLTYLAYKEETTGEGATEANIKYIDQQTAGSDPIVFSYETAKDNLTGTTVKFGADTQATAETETESNRVRVVTITTDSDSEIIYLPREVVDADYATSLSVAEGYNITAATMGAESVMDYISVADDGYIYFTDDARFVTGSEIVVTITEDQVDPVEPAISSVVANAGRFKYVGSENYTEKLTMFAKATTNLKNGFGGMVITTDADVAADLNKFVIDGHNVTDYAALYKGNDNAFAVQLLNETGVKDLTTGNYYGRIYVTSDNGGDENKTVYSDVFHFKATVEAE